MDFKFLNFQIHKYKIGHQLVSSSIDLDRTDQDLVDRLSDISGPLRPNEIFEPYFTCYPLPSQKNFVIARTWQDLIAPRAGCVLTKSVFILMQEWESISDVSFIFDLLSNSSCDLMSPLIDNPWKDQKFVAVKEGITSELVEALFLEQRKPALVFDSKKAEQIIIRLYQTFWPTLRRQFATCTYALSARIVSGKSFDLLFTNSRMRGQFSDWLGRRIDGSIIENKVLRHRWTKILVERIFEENIPSLTSSQNILPLKSQNILNESDLRLRLMWDELITKTTLEFSPVSLLGLLDILNSQSNVSNEIYESIQFKIKKIIPKVLENTEATEAWKFFYSLLIKLNNRQNSEDLLEEVAFACIKLTSLDPKAAINFVSEVDTLKRDALVILYSSIGDGLSKNLNNAVGDLLGVIQSELLIQLIAASKHFSSSLMRLISDGNLNIDLLVEKALKINPSDTLSLAQNNLLSFLKDENHKGIVLAILSSQQIATYRQVVLSIIKKQLLKINSFEVVVLEYANQLTQFDFLLNSIIEFNYDSDDLLLQILQNQKDLIETFYYDQRLPKNKKDELLSKFLNTLSPEEIAQIANKELLYEELIQIIIKDDQLNPNILIRLINAAPLKSDIAINTINLLPNSRINKIEGDCMKIFIERLIDSKIPAKSFTLFLSKLNTFFAEFFIKYFVVQRSKTDLIVAFNNFYSLGNGGINTLIRYMPVLNEAFSESPGDSLEHETLLNWKNLFLKITQEEIRLNTAASMIHYSFKCKHYDPTQLLMVSFPFLYQVFYNNTKNIRNVFNFHFFKDWDKCKTLRFELVAHYVKHNWSSMGLFTIAKEANIIREALDILFNTKIGKKYVEYFLKNENNKSDPFYTVLEKSMRKFLK